MLHEQELPTLTILRISKRQKDPTNHKCAITIKFNPFKIIIFTPVRVSAIITPPINFNNLYSSLWS